jgi:hypothetical protein
MDEQNQVINPTLAKQKAVSAKHAIGKRDFKFEQPGTTAKHEARVELRRQQMEK